MWFTVLKQNGSFNKLNLVQRSRSLQWAGEMMKQIFPKQSKGNLWSKQLKERNKMHLAKLPSLCVFTVWFMKDEATNQRAEVSLEALT